LAGPGEKVGLGDLLLGGEEEEAVADAAGVVGGVEVDEGVVEEEEVGVGVLFLGLGW